jgi:hypothetical protein
MDNLTPNLVYFGRHLVDAGRDIKTSFNGINLYS